MEAPGARVDFYPWTTFYTEFDGNSLDQRQKNAVNAANYTQMKISCTEITFCSAPLKD